MSILSYRRVGKGEPLVLVHGYLGGEKMWKFQEVLQERFDLIMPSLSGYGESADREAPSTIRGNAEQVFELLDHLNINEFNLLGHSMGGMIVQEMAALKPERVKKLLCFGTGALGVLPNRFETIAESRHRIETVGLEKAREKITKSWFVDFEKGDGYQLCLAQGKKATTQAALASLAAWEKWNGTDQLKRILCPTLIIWPTLDRSYDWNQQKILNDGIADSRIELIEGCAHNAHMERPEYFNQLIKDFLSNSNQSSQSATNSESTLL